jgi:anti-sigma regulatory factor (Ser/Thr protein kinase)
VRRLAERLGFGGVELVQLVTAISEVAGNVWRHAGRGELRLTGRDEPERVGVEVLATDSGPGIADIELAMRDGWSTMGGLGLGLPGARRLMDEFRISSGPSAGTTVGMTRWLRKPGASAAAERPLLEWAGSADAPEARLVACPFPNGVMLAALSALGPAIAADIAAAVLERHAPDSPITLVERVHAELQGTGAAVLALASVSSLDARMTWLALGGGGVLVGAGNGRAHQTAPALVGAAGRSLAALRAATLPVLRDDLLVLTAGRVPVPAGEIEIPTGGELRELADRLAEGGPVLVARFLRGARERRRQGPDSR